MPEIVDEYVSPEEQPPDTLVEIFLNIQKQIDVFTDLEPPVVMAINNAIAYARKLEEFRVFDKTGKVVIGPDPALRVAKWIEQYLRLRASVKRRSRNELAGIYNMEKARTISRINIDGTPQQGNMPGRLR